MIQVIPNQAISIWTDEDFNTKNYACTQDNRTFCQIVYPTDSTQFQVRMTEETGNNLITNGDFEDGLNGWNYLGGTWISRTVTGFTVATAIVNGHSLLQVLAVEAGVTYKVTYQIFNYDQPNGFIELIAYANIGNVTITGEIPDVGELGTFTSYVRFDTSHNATMGFICNAGVVADIDNVGMFKLSVPEISIQTCEGSHVADVTDIEYFEDIATVTIDWTNLEDGCYRICVGGMEDTSQNLLLPSLFIAAENGRIMLDENGAGIKWFG